MQSAWRGDPQVARLLEHPTLKFLNWTRRRWGTALKPFGGGQTALQKRCVDVHSNTWMGFWEKGPSVVAGMDHVAEAVRSGHQLHLEHRGTVGRKVGVLGLPNGRRARIDLSIESLAQSLNNLPLT